MWPSVLGVVVVGAELSLGDWSLGPAGAPSELAGSLLSPMLLESDVAAVVSDGLDVIDAGASSLILCSIGESSACGVRKRPPA